MIQRVKLTRTETGDEGTFGSLLCGSTKLYTGELPKRDVDHNGISDSGLSCIDPGIFTCKKMHSDHLSPLFGMDLYQVMNVKGRVGIFIHPANWMGDKTKNLKCQLEGCISLGKAFGKLQNQKAVLSSRDAIIMFMGYLKGADFELEIVESFA